MPEKKITKPLKPANNFFSKRVESIPFLFSFAIVLYFIIERLLDTRNTDFFLNPDFSSYPYMIKNVMFQHGNFFAWHMGSALNFFPLLVTLFISTSFIINPYTNLLLNAIFQMIFMAMITLGVFKAATNSKEGYRLGALSVLLFFLQLLMRHEPGNIYGPDAYLTAIFAPGFHFGTALLVFSALFLVLKIVTNDRNYLKFLLFILLILSEISDPLISIYFTIPMAMTLTVFYYIKELSLKNYLSLLFIIIIAFLTAFVVSHLLPIQYEKMNYTMSFQWGYCLGFIKTLVIFVQRNILAGALWFAFLFWAPFSLWRSFSKKDSSYRLVDYVILFQLVTIVIAGPIIVLSVGQILPPGYDVLSWQSFLHQPIISYNQIEIIPCRYLINYLIGPTCFGLPLLLYKHIQAVKYLKKGAVYIGLMLLIILAAIVFKPKHKHSHYNNFLQFQPGLVKCFDKYVRQDNLTNGFGNSYFAAALINAYNKDNVQVALVSDNFRPIRWQNTSQAYSFHNYNFAISSDESIEPALYKEFGKPTSILHCSGTSGQDIGALYNLYIFIYQNNRLNRIFLANSE